MALTIERLDALEDECRRTLNLKQGEAERGHDWVVDSHILNSFQLLELVAVARLGLPVWLEIETGNGSAKERALAQRGGLARLDRLNRLDRSIDQL
jgi:hypothetical protein